MIKAETLFYDCVEFWQRMGVKKEDNIVALATYDVVCAKVWGWREYYFENYFKLAKKIHEKLKTRDFDKNRGRSGWLKETDL